MNDIKEAYKFMNETWNYIKTTSAPAQTDQEAWDAINDKSMQMCKDFQTMIVEWMHYLRRESMK
jgi:hypothetical protein